MLSRPSGIVGGEGRASSVADIAKLLESAAASADALATASHDLNRDLMHVQLELALECKQVTAKALNSGYKEKECKVKGLWTDVGEITSELEAVAAELNELFREVAGQSVLS